VVLLGLVVVVGDRVAVQHVDSTISSRIERRIPGSHADVTISSSPFLVRLAISGTVRQIDAHVTGVTAGSLTLSSVDVAVHNLRISRTSLMDGSVRLLGMSSATITVTVSVAEVLQALGDGSATGLGALASGLSGSVRAEPNGVYIAFGPIAFSFPFNSLVPCVGSAHDRDSNIVLTCTTTVIPPALETARV